MSELLQQTVAGVLVAGCALYSVWRLASVRQRVRMLETLAVLPGLRRAPWLVRLREATLLKAGGCGGCAQAPGHAAKSRVTDFPQARQDAASRNRTPGALRR